MKDVLALPNAITLSRILAIPILILLFFWGPLWLFYTVLALVLASDLVDGALARSQRQITALGKLLDPVADKMLFLSLFVALTVEGRLPWWALIAFAVPPIVLILGALWLRWQSSRWLVIEARALGKASSTMLSVGLVGLLLEPIFPVLSRIALFVLYGGIALSYAALGEYIVIALQQWEKLHRDGSHKL
jgi:cardiolipin synthase